MREIKVKNKIIWKELKEDDPIFQQGFIISSRGAILKKKLIPSPAEKSSQRKYRNRIKKNDKIE